MIAGIGLSFTTLGYVVVRRLQQMRATKNTKLSVGLDKKRFGLSDCGFVPHHSEVLARLPSPFDIWENAADQLPCLIASREIWAVVDGWPILDVTKLLVDEFSPSLRRAHTVLSMIAQAYVWGDAAAPAKSLPSALSVPLHAVSQRLGLPPVMTHASCELWNWRHADESADSNVVTQDRLRCTTTVTGTADEEWFHCTSIAVQMIAGPSVIASYDVLAEAAPTSDVEAVEDYLETLAERLEEMASTMKRLDEKCAPEVFWRQMRPLLQGPGGGQSLLPHGLLYEGVPSLAGKPQSHNGASAAQSSAIPVFDAVLGVQHQDSTVKFVKEMMRYMPGPHREFVELMQAQKPLRETILQWRSAGDSRSESLVSKFNICLDKLGDFRRAHRTFVCSHIMAMKAKDVLSENKVIGADYGAKYSALRTHGSPMDALLNGTIKSTLDAKI